MIEIGYEGIEEEMPRFRNEEENSSSNARENLLQRKT